MSKILFCHQNLKIDMSYFTVFFAPYMSKLFLVSIFQGLHEELHLVDFSFYNVLVVVVAASVVTSGGGGGCGGGRRGSW